MSPRHVLCTMDRRNPLVRVRVKNSGAVMGDLRCVSCVCCADVKRLNSRNPIQVDCASAPRDLTLPQMRPRCIYE